MVGWDDWRVVGPPSRWVKCRLGCVGMVMALGVPSFGWGVIVMVMAVPVALALALSGTILSCRADEGRGTSSRRA